MSSTSVTSPFELDQEDWWSRGSSKLARRLCEASQFLRNLHVRMRFRRTSRAPLQLLRFQVLGEVAECDWLARLPDPWDADLSEGIRHRHTSLQALKDAIDVRALMFGTLPQIETAYFRAYRESHVYGRENDHRGVVRNATTILLVAFIHSLCAPKLWGFASLWTGTRCAASQLRSRLA